MITINASNSPNPGIPEILDFGEVFVLAGVDDLADVEVVSSSLVLEGMEDLTGSEVVFCMTVLDGWVVVIGLDGITSDCVTIEILRDCAGDSGG